MIFFHVMTYLNLGLPVPLGASGNEKSPSLTVTGDPAGLLDTEPLLRSFVNNKIPQNYINVIIAVVTHHYDCD